MTDFANALDSLFGSAEGGVDDCGLLGGQLADLTQYGAQALFLSTEEGSVLACTPIEAMQDCRSLAMNIAAARVAEGVEVFKYAPLRAGQSAVVAIRLATQDSGAVFVGLAHPGNRPIDLSSEQLARLQQTAGAAARIIRAADEMRMLRARAEHLESELWTIRQAQAEAVTWLLNEREEHMQAKRLHIVQLESEVKKRSAALRDALERAEAANKAKSEFLSNVSHEIRTPMNAILGFCESLLTDELNEDDRVDALQTIRRNGAHLLEIINDILDLSKIEAGKLTTTLTPCSPMREVEAVLAMMRSRAAEKKLDVSATFEGPLPEIVRTDSLRLRQVLINLLGNAIKFTIKGGVQLRVSLTEHANRQDALLKFDVIDSGIGISPDQLQRLFKPFGQADGATTRQFGGTGLGLTISKRLAGMLGGDVTVTSVAGAGSTFSFTLLAGPRDQLNLIDGGSIVVATHAHEATPVRTEPVRLDGLRVLLAEDGIDNQRLVRAILQKAGAEVIVASNGRESVDHMRATRGGGNSIDVVLMDMQMPVLDGYSATRLLRAEGVRTPIVALTANAMIGDREKCLAAGCTEFLTKPIARQTLLEMIERVVDKTRRLTPLAMAATH
ncbi:MAG: ATP-binding protein [Phycisphaerae bacterium]